MTPREHEIVLHRILAAVSHVALVDPHAIMGRRRLLPMQRARMVCVWLQRQITGLSFPQLGRMYGLDSSTAVNAVHRVDAELATTPLGPLAEIACAAILRLDHEQHARQWLRKMEENPWPSDKEPRSSATTQAASAE